MSGERDNTPFSEVIQIRKELSEIIVGFTKKELAAREFAHRIEQIARETEDQIIHFVVCELWYLYDDVKDIEAELSKEWWDFSQRLLLLLEADDDVNLVSKYSIRNLISVCAVEVLFVILSRYGFTWPLAGVFLFEYVVFKWIVLVERRHFSGKGTAFPFASANDVAVLRERHSFKEVEYPHPVDGAQHSSILRKIWNEFVLFLLSPVLLFFRIFTADRIVVLK